MRLVAARPRPFLKWAGGKSRLLKQITDYLPPELKQGRVRRYIEPFVGGGAMLLYMASHYQVAELVICDLNPELILCYQVIRRDVACLIDRLAELEQAYLHAHPICREEMFYSVRQQLNHNRRQLSFQHYTAAWIERAAQIIFLNHTCFNGLYRLNASGDFNVPFGKYTQPRVYHASNLHTIARLLQDALILQGDFQACAPYVDRHTFVYFDPPYRPISRTASFTSYAQADFRDEEQHRLARFFRGMHTRGARLMLSNSDPKNIDPHDAFFDDLYAGFAMHRVIAGRVINVRSDRRGQISELLITNYG
ncbi:MAG: DNA adenine methylase [Chloroflexaceae bacterium]|nr:DNA adenine methylase [Chloroflexaceae bacterium]